MTTAFHPWRELRAQPHLQLIWRRLHHLYGETDGLAHITMHPNQLQVERRVTIAHELLHVERGHTAECSASEEISVRRAVARRLVPIDALLDALRWTESWDEAADELWVTVEVFRDRLDDLSEDERAMVAALSEEIDRGA